MLCGIADYDLVNQNSAHTFIYELKYDGDRIKATKDKTDKVCLLNRRGSDVSFRYPELIKELISFLPLNSEIDGEVIAKRQQFAGGDFQLLSKRSHLKDRMKIRLLSNISPCTFVVFDVLKWENKSYITKPIEERKAFLKTKLPYGLHLERPLTFPTLEKGWTFVKAFECEGLILKKKHSRYEFRRSESWLKLKDTKKIEVVVEKFERTAKGGFLIYANNGKIKVAVGKKENQDTIIRMGVGTKIIVSFLNYTEAGKLRQPTFVRVIK